MAKPTILLAPTDPTSPLLADGPCGARVPTIVLDCDGAPLYNQATPIYVGDQAALVLAIDGVPVESACIAVARAVAESCATVPPDRLTDILHAHWFVELETDESEGWPVALRVGLDGVEWRLPYKDPDPDMEREPDEMILAHIAAARLNCRVIVLDGGEVRS